MAKMISMTTSNMAGLGVAAVGQEHVVYSDIDGGDLVREVTPDTLNKTPHPEEYAYSREDRGDGVWSHADSVTARAPRPHAEVYPEMFQLETFESVHAALTSGKAPRAGAHDGNG